MDINISIHDIPIDVSSEIYESLERDFHILNKFLGIENVDFMFHFTTNSEYNDYKDNLDTEYLFNTLRDPIINYFRIVLDMDISSNYKMEIDMDKVNILIQTRNLIMEQLGYMNGGRETSKSDTFYEVSDLNAEKEHDPKFYIGCKWWYIKGELNNYNYGGIFLFWNENNPNHVLIQGIAKSLVPTIASIFYPIYNKYLPKLNSILELGIESLSRRLNAKDIYVIPIGKQGDILEKHYGYEKVNMYNINWDEFNMRYPCVEILGFNRHFKSKLRSDKNVYIKRLK